jgi:hypothetical protein
MAEPVIFKPLQQLQATAVAQQVVKPAAPTVMDVEAALLAEAVVQAAMPLTGPEAVVQAATQAVAVT